MTFERGALDPTDLRSSAETSDRLPAWTRASAPNVPGRSPAPESAARSVTDERRIERSRDTALGLRDRSHVDVARQLESNAAGPPTRIRTEVRVVVAESSHEAPTHIPALDVRDRTETSVLSGRALASLLPKPKRRSHSPEESIDRGSSPATRACMRHLQPRESHLIMRP